MCSRFLLTILGLFLLSSCGPQTYNYSNVDTAVPQLVVQAEATVKAMPDLLKMRLGVVTEAEDAGQALAENNQRMEALMLMLEDMGVSREALATGQFQIRPEWSVPPRPTPANWQRKIVGYRVSNELHVATPKVDLAGDLLGLAQLAGANQIGGLQFDLAEPELHRQQAITEATEKAIRKAQTLAAAAGARLGEIVSLTLNDSGYAAAPTMMLAEARAATADSVPIAAGKVDVQAGVTIVYRLLKNSQTSH
ncbi:MAG: SIMPL domain-containing protein [Deltaproteobacteria bacterium]|nr:SIMPL domain-containing protein [Deltaproteobacteria bacterium]MCW8892454.1 SIMPL domain-containing protein [Deltaproteobacteria bacterium]